MIVMSVAMTRVANDCCLYMQHTRVSFAECFYVLLSFHGVSAPEHVPSCGLGGAIQASARNGMNVIQCFCTLWCERHLYRV